MEPSPETDKFATCGTCARFNREKGRCYWFSNSKADEVDENDTCGLYVQGPNTTEEPRSLVTKKEAGFFDGPPQCRRCNAFDNRDKSHQHCDLYVQLNRMFPNMWKLKEEVKPHACCNAWEGGERNPKRFGPYGPIPDPDDPKVGGSIMKAGLLDPAIPTTRR
jgi:hypothetical protein